MTRKRIYLFILSVSLLSLALTSAQQKENTDRIKVIISDGQDTRVVIDTTFSGNYIPGDSILLKDDRTGDSKFYVFSNRDDKEPVKHYEIIRHSSGDGKDSDTRYIYINDGKGFKWDGGGNLSISDDTLESEEDMDTPEHIIARDGIVISVEGKDETMVKDLLDAINKKLDTYKNGASKENTGKTPGTLKK